MSVLGDIKISILNYSQLVDYIETFCAFISTDTTSLFGAVSGLENTGMNVSSS